MGSTSPGAQETDEAPLHFHRELVDLVEEQGAAGGRSETSLRGVPDPCPAGYLGAEQVGLDLAERPGAAAGRHDERTVPAAARQVERAGEQLLADPGLAAQQHMDTRIDRGAELLHDLLHGLRLDRRHEAGIEIGSCCPGWPGRIGSYQPT